MMNTSIIISVIGLIISAISVTAVIYFNSKNSKKTDTKDIERQVAEQTKVNMKLDEINRNTTDIKYDVSAVKKDIQKHSEKIVELEASNKSLYHRLDNIEDRLNMNGGKNNE